MAFGIVLIIATIQWFVDGRKNFSGPVSEGVAVTIDDDGNEDQGADQHSVADEKDVGNGGASKGHF